MAPRIARLATAAAVQLAALVLAHQLVYLARYGSRFGEALVHSGHGDAWSAAVVTSVALAAGLAVLALGRLVWLGAVVRRARRRAGAAPGTAGLHAIGADLQPAALLRSWLSLAPRVAALQLVLLTAQENIERVGIGQAAPGPGVLLSPEYAGGAWITIGVALVVSWIVALFAWRQRVLLARLRAVRAALLRRVAEVQRPAGRAPRPVESLLGRRSALRAPPSVVAA